MTTSAEAIAIGWQGVAAAFLLVIVAIVVSWRRQLGLERSLLEASARGIAQLIVVGFALRLLLAEGTSMWWSVAWVTFIVGFAAWTITRRAEEVDGLFGLAFFAMGLTAVVTLGTIFALDIFPYEARYMVPTAGMMVGNAMKGVVLVTRRTVDDLVDQRAEIEARVALGATWREATRRLFRRALRDAMTPQIETVKGLGLVFLPGAMTGLILAGADPLDAVLVQAAIMFLILGGVAISTLVIQTGIATRLFTDDDRMVPLERAAS